MSPSAGGGQMLVNPQDIALLQQQAARRTQSKKQMEEVRQQIDGGRERAGRAVLGGCAGCATVLKLPGFQSWSVMASCVCRRKPTQAPPSSDPLSSPQHHRQQQPTPSLRLQPATPS